jgi:DNA-binding Lrp family transcriptional regulator
MNSIGNIDEIDAKILSELIEDARKKITDIAKKCGVSSTAILNRIKRLKAEGIITGTVLFSDMSRLGYMFPASIGISLNQSQESEVLKLIAEKVHVIMLSRSVGEDNLFLFVVANNLHEIENLKQTIKGCPRVRKVRISIWSTPTFNFENINLQPTEVRIHG